jgi:uncharacterized protein YqeY
VPALADQLAADLLVARKARDVVTVNALRTALAALANAEAPPAPPTSSASPPVMGLVEHDRLVRSADDHQEILREQVATRVAAAEEYDAIGRPEAAATVRAEAAVLERYLASPRPGPGTSTQGVTDPGQDR